MKIRVGSWHHKVFSHATKHDSHSRLATQPTWCEYLYTIAKEFWFYGALYGIIGVIVLLALGGLGLLVYFSITETVMVLLSAAAIGVLMLVNFYGVDVLLWISKKRESCTPVEFVQR